MIGRGGGVRQLEDDDDLEVSGGLECSETLGGVACSRGLLVPSAMIALYLF